MREIVLDTETTGLRYLNGDKLTEIACIELYDLVPTGRTYQQYINPKKEMSFDAVRISGLTNSFLNEFPTFPEIADSFLEFIGNDIPLVIHNAPFDMGFLNHELNSIKKQPISLSRVIDTLPLARKLIKNARYNLDALCRRFGIDTTQRTLHGGLIDCELLSKVYLELRGGKQKQFVFEERIKEEKIIIKKTINTISSASFNRRSFPISQEELEKHAQAILSLKDSLWKKMNI